MARTKAVACMVLALAACKPAHKAPAPSTLPDLSQFALTPAPAALHRLSQVEYTNSISDLISPAIVVPLPLDQDLVIDGFVEVGMTTAGISPTGTSRYEKAALSIASQTVASQTIRSAVVPCTPASVTDTTCLTAFVTAFGKRAWRRPLSTVEVNSVIKQVLQRVPLANSEVSAIANVGAQAAAALNDPWQGIAAAMTEILESPNFLFRVELGEPDGSGGYRYSNYEMASRLAAFLTASIPDQQLMDAADQGELVTDDGLRAQIERVLALPSARVGMRHFFTDMYALAGLNTLNQDPTVYPAMSSDLGPSALQETLNDLESIVFDQNADFRTFFTGRTTSINRRLAAVYNVPAPSLTTFGTVQLPPSGLRAGFLGSAGFLALYAHPTTTSPVLRGKFVREILLCDVVPDPPAGVNTGLEPVSPGVVTMRQRDAEHLLVGSTCAGCHALMDPIGLGFENFDAVGTFRTMDTGEPIDASGNLDGVNFSGPTQLSQVIVSSPKFPNCVAKKMFEYATGMEITSGEYPIQAALSSAFVQTGYHIKDLMEIVAMSSGFRRAGAPQ